MLHHKCNGKADVVPVRQHSCISPFTELWGGTAGSLPHSIKRAWSALKACIFPRISRVWFLWTQLQIQEPLCVFHRALSLQTDSFGFQASQAQDLFCVLSLYVCITVLLHTAGCCRDEMKRSLAVCFYECVNLFLNLLNYLLCLPFFNDRWICLWLILFPKVPLGWSKLIVE